MRFDVQTLKNRPCLESTSLPGLATFTNAMSAWQFQYHFIVLCMLDSYTWNYFLSIYSVRHDVFSWYLLVCRNFLWIFQYFCIFFYQFWLSLILVSVCGIVSVTSFQQTFICFLNHLLLLMYILKFFMYLNNILFNLCIICL